MDLLVGYKLDRYEIRRMMGRGNLGTVYQAYDPDLDRNVAIKVCHPYFERQPDFQKRFQQEARISTQLEHPSIIKVYDTGKSQSFLYIVMELITGGSLRAVMDRENAAQERMSLYEVIPLIAQVADALNYAHQKGIIHRDVKPDNILLRPTPSQELPFHPVLSDLGLAKLVTGGLQTEGGVISGMPAYISPEQAHSRPVTAKTDIYSLGVILYELCAGQLPYPIKTINEAEYYLSSEAKPALPSSLRSEIIPALERVIMCALEKDPGKRFASAAQFAAALREVRLPVKEPVTDLISRPGERTEVVIEDPLEAPPNPFKDYLQVSSPSRGTEPDWVEIPPYGVMCGRAPNCDIHLDEPNSAYHNTKIELVGRDYMVTDLNSNTGRDKPLVTYLDNTPLLPHVPQKWVGQVLRIGQTSMKLCLKKEQPETRKPGDIPQDVRLLDVPEVSIEPTEMIVEKGGVASAKVTVRNQSRTDVNRYRITVENLDPSWVNPKLKDIALNPGEFIEIPLILRPPARPTSLGKNHPFSIKVENVTYPGQVGRANGMLTIQAYYQFAADLSPEQFRDDQVSKIAITNQGNAPDTFTVKFEDKANALTYHAPPKPPTVDAGKTDVVKFQITPNNRRLVGGDLTRLFWGYVSSANSQEVVTVQGEYTERATMPVWAAVLVALLLLLLVASTIVVVVMLVTGRNLSNLFGLIQAAQTLLAGQSLPIYLPF